MVRRSRNRQAACAVGGGRIVQTEQCRSADRKHLLLFRRAALIRSGGRDNYLSGSCEDGQFVLTAAGAGKETTASCRDYKQVAVQRVARVARVLRNMQSAHRPKYYTKETHVRK
jgi:hypothetical protein